jgi:hypothetical protein
MSATRRYRSDRHTWRAVELAFVFAFTFTMMLVAVGAFASGAHGHFSCTIRSIASVSDTCTAR